MYPEYILQNREFLEKIRKARSTRRLANLIREANDGQLLAIVDICHNILKGRLKLRHNQRTKLSKNADYYRSLSRARTPATTKKRIQEGGGPALLGAIVAPILGALAQTLLDKALSKHDETR